MSEFLMPSLGADMEAGTLVEQLISPGQPVKHGDIIAAVETQKGVIEIEAFEDGVLDRWLVGLGARVPVGTPLAMIRTAGEAAQGEPETPGEDEPAPPEAPQPHDPGPQPAQPEEPQPAIPEPMPPGPEIPSPEIPMPEIPQPQDSALRAAARPRITPAARRLAAQRGIDTRSLAPRPGATVTRADIARMAERAGGAEPGDMRRAIAAAMSRSKREIPHYYLSHTVDMTRADAFVAAANRDRAPGDRLLPGALYLRAIARAVAKFPEMNGHFEDGRFTPGRAVHAGLAISLRGGGLAAPAILDAGALDLDGTMQAMRDLVVRVRAGRFRARELSDATITLTSLGERGVDRLYGVIYPPQVAIVGIGTPSLRPGVEGGIVVPRLLADMTLAADHRVSDGHRGALFLRAIAKELQSPEAL